MATMVEFPDPEKAADADGLVAVGGDLKVPTLISAYTQGIFPWPQEGLPMLWFSPDPRGILDFKDFHVPRSLQKWSTAHPNWRFKMSHSFPEILEACQSQGRPGQNGTWITEDMKKAYLEFFKKGYVKTMECWENDELIGGMYGVDVGLVFSGESMFYKKSNASKMCLWKMVEYLQAQGRTWMDLQMITPVTKSMGGKYISRREYLRRLKDSGLR